jgi:flagellar biosynthetic protein FlhB
MAFEMVKQMAATLAIVAALDYAYQRYQFEKNLRMTKQEVKDEMRDAEGNPEIKGRIRRKMREISRKRMMADVKTASVVITNPTHFAVALKYEAGKGGAPKVVAKGADLIALKIREIAAENNVPLVENPPLARSLFKLTEVGDEIPQSLYKAVAEVLAMIWRLDARRRGARR